MAGPTNEEVIHRYLAAHAAHDYDTVGVMRDSAWTMDWPQSGERVRGNANDRAIMDNWPGGLPTALGVRAVGSEDRWVVTPFNSIQRVVGSGDFWWAAGTATYPDGSTWHISALLELKVGRLYHETWYFGPPLDAPTWRAAWVERTS